MEDDILKDLFVLQSHFDGLMDRVQSNSLTLKKFQSFEMKLLNLNSLGEMIELLLDEAISSFDLDLISLCLIDEKGELATFIEHDGYDFKKFKGLIFLENNKLLKSTFGMSATPFLGSYKQSRCTEFFQGLQRKPASVAIIPLTRRGKHLGSLNLGSFRPDRFTHMMATDFIEHMGSVVSICLENNLNFELMRRTSLVDTLTGVNNRRFLEQRIGEEIDRSHRQDQPLSCLFLDLDHFKSVNDNYGHQAGDYVLSLIAAVIKKQLRNNDVLARYGGEEFVALLSNIDEDQSFEIAERIRSCINDLPINYQGQIINVTMSIGLSTFHGSNSGSFASNEISSQLIHEADQALYQSKHNGRNQVTRGKSVYIDNNQSQIAVS